MQEQHAIAVEGIPLVTLVFGFVGAALGISYMPPMTRKEQYAALGSGVVIAYLMPELLLLIAKGLGWEGIASVITSSAVNRGLAFVGGVLGMFIIPGLIVFGQELKIDPIGAFKWLMGGPRPSTKPKE